MSLVLKNLTKTFKITSGAFFGVKGSVRALYDVSTSVEKGRSLGIVGESGSGKTTLAKILAGFLNADSGAAEFDSHDLLLLPQKKRAKLVQMVFQDPFASLNPKLICRTQIIEALKTRDPEGTEEKIERDAIALLSQVGLPQDFLKRYPHQLSGGQRQRFAIARALSAHPELLIADEPVSSLDLSVQAQIINLLNNLRKDLKFTLITISHDLSVIANLCDVVLVLKDGLVMEQGPVQTVLSRPQSEYTKHLLAATPMI